MKKFYLKPKLFSVMKNYSKEQAVKDLIAGIIVAIIALPLSIALALASNVPPACGVYTAIAAGFVVFFRRKPSTNCRTDSSIRDHSCRNCGYPRNGWLIFSYHSCGDSTDFNGCVQARFFD